MAQGGRAVEGASGVWEGGGGGSSKVVTGTCNHLFKASRSHRQWDEKVGVRENMHMFNIVSVYDKRRDIR